MHSPARLLTAAFLLVAPGAASAAAEPAPGPSVALAYRAAAGCPPRSGVIEQLQARGLRVSPAADVATPSTGPGPTALSIDVARGFTGRLTIAAPGTPTLAREVTGKDCAAVTQSLALVAGLALKPDVDGPDQAPPTLAAGSPPPVVADGAETPPAWLIGATARGMTALGPGLAPGFAAFVEHPWTLPRGPTLALVFAVGTAAPGAVEGPTGSAQWRAFLGRAEACWFAGLVSGRVLALSPCATLEAGVVRGSGTTARPTTAMRPWVAPGIAARAAVALTHRVQLSLVGHAFAPLVRDTFVLLAPDTTLHRTAAVGVGADLGLAVAFW